jgi:peptide/nickel transport system permease protein
MIPTMLMVTVVVFALIRFIPGDIIDIMVSEMAHASGMETELTADHLRHVLGLDVPIHVQYGRWVADALRGDLGWSLWRNEPVRWEIMQRLPVSLELGIFAIIAALSLALPIGTYSAIRQDTAGDYAGRTIAVMAISLPSFWLGTLIMIYPSIYLGWSPPMKYIPLVVDPLANLGQFIIPAIILGMALSGTTMRMTRTMMLEVLRQDYIRTAWSKGLRERTVITRHALKNALIPVVTMIGLLIPVLIGGSIVIETIFALPGIGLLLIEALRTRDYPVISGINLALASSVLLINLVIDLTYGWLDPRIQYK